MTPQMENAGLAGTGGSEVMKSGKDLKHSEYASPSAPTQVLQALHLSRRCAISVAMAAIIAPLAFGERA